MQHFIFSIFKFIYYLLAVVAIVWELLMLYNTEKVLAFKERLKTHSKTNEWDNDDQKTTDEAFTVMSMGYMAWTFVGLFSFQWVMFAAIIILSLFPKLNDKWAYKADAILTLIILVLIILNAYHFHIDPFIHILNLLN